MTDATKPYKGPDSFQIEDASLFFGRDQEGSQLIAKILSCRFALLHAQSGAGKTSLINARILPGLEERGWTTIRALPQNDPVESIRITTLQTLFPPLTVEVEAIREASEMLAPGRDSLTIAELLLHYDALGVRDPLQRHLVRRRQAATPIRAAVFPSSGEFDPLFARMLRGTLDAADFGDHVRALESLSGDGAPGELVDDQTLVRDIVERLEHASEYQSVVNEFYPPAPDLYSFFRHIVARYGARRSKFGLVLILDQFEELFTRFQDPGLGTLAVANPPLDWKLRWELFAELERLYASRADDGSTLPIRYVLSMRDEYIAQLDPLRQFVGDLDDNAYHLTLLTRAAAQEAVSKPAQLFGYQYSDECFRQIVDQLTKEDRFVEPTHLQIVCDALWKRRGHDISSQSSEAPELPQIGVTELAELNGAAGILRSFFRDFLDQLDPELRIEAIDMLELLVTSTGTRNIVQKEELTRPKYRRASVREQLLAQLERRSIVRLESRLGGQFAEITHEFLIGPILEARREELTANPEYGAYRSALRALAAFDGQNFREPNERLLSRPDFLALDRFRERVLWEDWSVELMVRSGVTLGISSQQLAFWMGAYQGLTIDSATLFADQPRTRSILTLEELALLEGADEFSAALATAVLRSLITLKAPHERDDLARWTRKVLNAAAT